MEPDELAGWQARQRSEAALLRAMLGAAPRLRSLELTGVGPLMYDAVVDMVEQVGVESGNCCVERLEGCGAWNG
jgi:hypothetical protein